MLFDSRSVPGGKHMEHVGCLPVVWSWKDVWWGGLSRAEIFTPLFRQHMCCYYRLAWEAINRAKFASLPTQMR